MIAMFNKDKEWVEVRGVPELSLRVTECVVKNSEGMEFTRVTGHTPFRDISALALDLLIGGATSSHWESVLHNYGFVKS